GTALGIGSGALPLPASGLVPMPGGIPGGDGLLLLSDGAWATGLFLFFLGPTRRKMPAPPPPKRSAAPPARANQSVARLGVSAFFFLPFLILGFLASRSSADGGASASPRGFFLRA